MNESGSTVKTVLPSNLPTNINVKLLTIIVSACAGIWVTILFIAIYCCCFTHKLIPVDSDSEPDDFTSDEDERPQFKHAQRGMQSGEDSSDSTSITATTTNNNNSSMWSQSEEDSSETSETWRQLNETELNDADNKQFDKLIKKN